MPREPGESDEAAASLGDKLLQAQDAGVQFVPRLGRRDLRGDKAAMRRLHGYAPTDQEPVAEEGEEEPEDLNFEDLDEFG